MSAPQSTTRLSAAGSPAADVRVDQCLLSAAGGSEEGDAVMLFRRLWCALRGHRYAVLQRFGTGSRRVICSRCRGDWVMHDPTHAFVPWDGELAAMYESFGESVRPAPWERGAKL